MLRTDDINFYCRPSEKAFRLYITILPLFVTYPVKMLESCDWIKCAKSILIAWMIKRNIIYHVLDLKSKFTYSHCPVAYTISVEWAALFNISIPFRPCWVNYTGHDYFYDLWIFLFARKTLRHRLGLGL